MFKIFLETVKLLMDYIFWNLNTEHIISRILKQEIFLIKNPDKHDY